jgi:SAM-dependent methyltransferase
VVQDAALGASRADDALLEEVRRFYDTSHDSIERTRKARRYFYATLTRVLQARVPPGQRILDVGCGSGHLLAALAPSEGVGIDISARAIAAARAAYPGANLYFLEGDGADPRTLAQAGGPFDVVVMVNVITHLTDVQAAFEALGAVCHPRTRLLIYSYSRLWQPALRVAEILGLKHQPPPEAWLPTEEVVSMLRLASFEVVRRDYQILCPAFVPLLADLLNRYAGRLPGIEWLSLMYGVVARPSLSRFPRARS